MQDAGHSAAGVVGMKPDIVIVIEKGMVAAMATAGRPMTYRIIDLDVKVIMDLQPDASNVDMEKYTKEMMEDD